MYVHLWPYMAESQSFIQEIGLRMTIPWPAAPSAPSLVPPLGKQTCRSTSSGCCEVHNLQPYTCTMTISISYQISCMMVSGEDIHMEVSINGGSPKTGGL